MLVSVPPWVQTVKLRWHPVLRFFEERTQLLRELEDVGLLRAFQWEELEIRARLDRYQFLSVAPTGASLQLTSPTADPDVAQTALDLTLHRLQPKDVTMTGLRLMYLVPIETDATDAQAASASKLVPELSPEAKGVDWAILLDGESASLGVRFQGEFGILRPEEMPMRLSGMSSWPAVMAPDEEELADVDLDNLPGCGAFFNWSWDLQDRLAGNPKDEVVGLWTAAKEESETLTKRLVDRLGLAAAGGERVEARQ